MSRQEGPLTQDPGWPSLRMIVPWGLWPPLATRRARKPGQDGLLQLRVVFVSFFVPLVLISATVPWLADSLRGTMDTKIALAIVVTSGLGQFVVVHLLKRPLDCETLSGSYVSRFFLRMAFAAQAALLGFVLTRTTSNAWIYFVGVGFALIGFARHAPTAGHLARDQQELTYAGCSKSLVAELRKGPLETNRPAKKRGWRSETNRLDH